MKRKKPKIVNGIYIIPDTREEAEQYVKELEKRAQKLCEAYSTIVKKKRLFKEEKCFYSKPE